MPLYDIIVSFFCLSFIPTNEILYTFFSTLLLSCFRSFHVSSSKDSGFFSKGCMGVCKFISYCILFQALALFGPCWLPGRPAKSGHERLECSLACFPLSSTLTPTLCSPWQLVALSSFPLLFCCPQRQPHFVSSEIPIPAGRRPFSEVWQTLRTLRQASTSQWPQHFPLFLQSQGCKLLRGIAILS